MVLEFLVALAKWHKKVLDIQKNQLVSGDADHHQVTMCPPLSQAVHLMVLEFQLSLGRRHYRRWDSPQSQAWAGLELLQERL